MTREEAIEILNDKAFTFCDLQRCTNDYSGWICEECDEALIMAKKALLQEPKCGEWIHGKEISREYIGDACVAIKYEDWHCSSCKMVVKEPYKPNWNYCPNCGTDMRGDEE